MQSVVILNDETELAFEKSPYFDTFVATIQHYDDGYSMVSINRQLHCCKKSEIIQRYISSRPDEMYERAISVTRELNVGSIMNFLRFRRRSVALCSIFTVADSLGVVLTRSLFQSMLLESGMGMSARHPFMRYRRIAGMSSDRFMACCRILERYGVLYAISDEHYVAMSRGV